MLGFQGFGICVPVTLQPSPLYWWRVHRHAERRGNDPCPTPQVPVIIVCQSKEGTALAHSMQMSWGM